MSDAFLTHLMHFALQTTGAERGMAVNSDNGVVALHNLSEEVTKDPKFTGHINIQAAFAADEIPHITNNMILDDELAPNTNTNFANLRLVVVFPFEGVGAVYIDQRVRHGVINQDITRTIQELAQSWLDADETALTTKDMVKRYDG